MKSETYKKTLEAARADLSELLHEREEINERIAKLSRVVEYLAALCEEPSGIEELLDASKRGQAGDLGLSDAVRLALKTQGAPMTPTQVRDKIVWQGFDVSKYASPMPPIHNTLKRLKDAGEIVEKETPEGRAYRWASGLERFLSPRH